MPMICVMCGKPTRLQLDTTAMCPICKIKYKERRALNELQSNPDNFDWDRYIKEK